jgi:CysZ protein
MGNPLDRGAAGAHFRRVVNERAAMIIRCARLAARQLFEREFRSVLWKSLALTLALLFVAWLGLEALVSTFLAPLLGPWPWFTTAVTWVLGAGMFVGAAFLIGPVTAIFAGIFTDDVALQVEKRHYPDDAPGRPMPILSSILLAARFTLVVIAANLAALVLVLLPGINFMIFFLVNAYLLGREYFQFAAMRFRSQAEAEDLRRAHGGQVFLAGLVIAAFMAVPILNLLTPLFATAIMVHLHKMASGDAPQPSESRSARMAA